MDQFASIAGRRDHAVLLDCRTLQWERLPLPTEVAVLIADSGVRRRLTDGALNDRRAECAEALRLLRESRPQLRALRDVDRATLDASAHLPDVLRRRVLHVIEECDRVQRGAVLLRGTDRHGGDGKAAAFGALMRDSHQSSRDLYQVSLPELDALAEAAWAAPGCHGAHLVGAGFGGCVVALVEAERAGEVTIAIERAFSARFGRMPRIDRCSTADGAGVV
jgi:galactokinase